jgi:hypothetical protein
MLNADAMLGIQKVDHEGVKEVKVKLPVKQLLKLHYLKLTSGKTFSSVITAALGEYFAEIEAGSEDTEL